MRGVSPPAVHKAVKSGRIAAAMTKDGLLDWEQADRLWTANTHPTSGYPGQINRDGKPTAPKVNGKTDAETLRQEARSIGIDPDNPPPMNESRTLFEAYRAKLAQLDYEEKTSKLIDQEVVKRDAFKLARLTRDAMMAIPDRLAAEIAGLTDPFVIHSKMTAEIRTAISEVAKVAAT